jgi:pectate lyase-like protein
MSKRAGTRGGLLSRLALPFRPASQSGTASPFTYAGYTGAAGPPQAGTYATNAWVMDLTGTPWVCTAGGTPGTWDEVAGGLSLPLPSGVPVPGAAPLATGVGEATAWGIPASTGAALLTRVLFTVPSPGAVHAALANEVTAVDTTSGSGTVNLPNGPAAGTLNAVKQVILGTGNSVTVACQGGDVINKAGGGTTQSLVLAGQGSLLHYSGLGTGVWTILSDDLPLSQLTAQFLGVPSGTPAAGQVPAATGTGTASAWGTVVDSVAAADASLTVGGTPSAVTVAAATLDVIAALHPPVGSVAMNAQKLVSLANGVASADGAAFGQTPAGGNTATVAQGGTGNTSFAIPWGLLAAGTTTTGALTALGLGIAGQALASGGAGAYPAWQYLPTEWFNVKNYGALGDGSDATSAVNAAVTAALAAGGGTVYFPRGKYAISSPVLCGGSIAAGSGALQFRGSGWGSQLSLVNGANCYIFDFSASSGGAAQFTPGALFADLYFNCNGANQTATSGAIYAHGGCFGVYEHLYIQAPYSAGIYFYQDGLGNYGHHNRVTNSCFFNGYLAGTSSTPGTGYGIYFYQSDENSVVGCTFQDCGTTAGVTNTQLYDTSAGHQAITASTFVTTRTNTVSMIKTQSNPAALQITDCQFDSGTTGNLLELNGPDCTVTGCTFLSFGLNASAAIHLTSNYTTISGCTFTPNGTLAYAVKEATTGANYNLIEGCTFGGGTYASGGPVLLYGANSSYISWPLTPVNGGTGLAALTAWTLLAGGTTATGALQQVAGTGTSGQVLTSAGAGALPAWVTAASYAPAGLPGATASSAYAGATTGGAPATGTWAVGQWVIDQTGSVWICTAAGTPGTWVQVAPAASAVSYAPAGLPGATASSAYAGATTGGAPATGTWAVGQWVVDRTGAFWVCTAAGTPGTWTAVSGSGGTLSNPMTAVGDLLYGGTAGAPARLAGSTSVTPKVLAQTGTGSASAAPAWTSVASIQDYGGLFGDGSDGAVALNGTNTYTGFATLAGSTYTLSRDIFATSLTISSGVTLLVNGFRVFCQGAVTNGGTISFNGITTVSSAGGAHTNSGTVQGGAVGGNGAAAATGANGTVNAGSAGSGSGGNGGNGSSTSGGPLRPANFSTPFPYRTPGPAVSGTFTVAGAACSVCGGNGGSGGGGDGTNSGGGGGGGAGIIIIVAWSVVNSGTISAAGGNGFTPTTGNCGGGGGGGGGLIIVYTLSAWTAGTTSVAGGTPGSGVGTGTAGTAGGAGSVLNVVV